MTDICPEDISLSELEKRWGITRNSIRNRAKALGVETLHPSHNTSLWPGKYLALGDQLHEHLKNGGEMALFPGVQLARTDSSEPSTDAIVRKEVRDFITQPDLDPRDELRRLRACIKDGDWWSTAELAIVLNKSASAISRWPDRYEIRPDIFVIRRSLNGNNWYKVLTERNEAPLSIQPALTERNEHSLPATVGFKAILPTFNCHLP